MLNNLNFNGRGTLLLLLSIACFSAIQSFALSLGLIEKCGMWFTLMYVCKGISVEPLLSAINRAQMGYYTENEYFEYLDIEKGLDLPLGASPHYNIRLLSPMNADTIVQPLNPKELRGVMTIAVSNEQGKREGVHTYIGLTLYNPKTRNFEPQICQSI